MKTDEKITLWSRESMNFNSVGEDIKHGVRNITFQSLPMNYWMRKLKNYGRTIGYRYDFAKMPT